MASCTTDPAAVTASQQLVDLWRAGNGSGGAASYLLLLQGRLVSDQVPLLQQLLLVLFKLLLSLTTQKLLGSGGCR